MRAVLEDFGKALGYEKWKTNTHWLDDKKEVCDWYGITCDAKSGAVTSIELKDNGLDGTLPDSLGELTDLSGLILNSARPAGYSGCGSNNLRNGSIPASIRQLTRLVELDLEYTCTAGTLDALGGGTLTSLENLSLHGNYISGTIPAALDALTNLNACII